MSLPRRLIHNEYDLQDIAEQQDRPIELIERDFALVTVAAHLVDQFPGEWAHEPAAAACAPTTTR